MSEPPPPRDAAPASRPPVVVVSLVVAVVSVLVAVVAVIVAVVAVSGNATTPTVADGTDDEAEDDTAEDDTAEDDGEGDPADGPGAASGRGEDGDVGDEETDEEAEEAAEDAPRSGEEPSFPEGEITDPEAHGFPGPTTTGVTDEDALEPHEGRLNADEDGEVIEDLHIDGRIYVTADDVTIRNVRIDARNEYGIHVDGGTGLVVEDTEIVGQDEVCIAGIAHGRYTARRIEVTNCDDGLRIGNDTTVEDSYIHGLRKSTGDEHNDAVQTTGGDNIVVRNNTLLSVWQRQTSSVFLQAIFGPIDDVLVEGNLLSGGTFTVYVEGVEGQPGPTNVVVRDNVFVEDSWRYGTLQTQNDPEITWEGNVSTTGEPIEP